VIFKAMDDAGYFLTSPAPFYIAKQVAINAARGAALQDNIVIAIVFSVVGAEAFINEAVEMASQSARGESDQKRITAFAELGKQIEESRGSLELKYQVARWILTGEAFDTSAAPYQDFALLIDVRNALIHYKLVDKIYTNTDGVMRMEIPKFVKQLRSKNVLADLPPDAQTSWLARITSPDMARWSCLSAAAMVRGIVEIVPQGVFRTRAASLGRSRRAPYTAEYFSRRKGSVDGSEPAFRASPRRLTYGANRCCRKRGTPARIPA
jgi:hypothetical protein